MCSSLVCLFADTYVKVCLLQQNRVVKTKKSEVVKKTSNPAFNESFTYKLAVTGLDTASVTVSTMQSLSGHRGEGDTLLGAILDFDARSMYLRQG